MEEASGSPSRSDSLPRARILAVDDEESNLRLLRRMLEGAGCARFVGTTDPREVPALFAELQPDLVVLDLNMPHLDGIQVMERLHPSLAEAGYLPILVISGDLTPEARRRALARGARDFLAKPFDVADALLRVRSLLQARFLDLEVRAQGCGLEERADEPGGAQGELLERLGQAAELRDNEGGHPRRVGELAARLAGALGLEDGWADLLRRAAPLHDVGKIGIPDAILLKPGPLTAEEWRRMERHTTIGAGLLARGRSPLVAMAERIALWHHERWTGGGYPHGLRGEAIPLEARIVAVADVFDALSHDRPYGPAWPVERVLDEIERGAGRLFDPEVSRALVRIEG